MLGASLALFADLEACHVQKSSVTICVLPTPSGWRATRLRNSHITDRIYFYPRPPGGGRHARSQPGYCKGLISIHALRVEGDKKSHLPRVEQRISIHALRVEGDTRRTASELHNPYFYPRPPGGGRQATGSRRIAQSVFLSTPSGWRATGAEQSDADGGRSHFYPRPPGGGRPLKCTQRDLRKHFYPRPPGGGRQFQSEQNHYCDKISIHALRVEGDRRGR